MALHAHTKTHIPRSMSSCSCACVFPPWRSRMNSRRTFATEAFGQALRYVSNGGGDGGDGNRTQENPLDADHRNEHRSRAPAPHTVALKYLEALRMDFPHSLTVGRREWTTRAFPPPSHQHHHIIIIVVASTSLPTSLLALLLRRKSLLSPAVDPICTRCSTHSA